MSFLRSVTFVSRNNAKNDEGLSEGDNMTQNYQDTDDVLVEEPPLEGRQFDDWLQSIGNQFKHMNDDNKNW